MVNKSPGRPRGSSTARARLLEAAQKHVLRGDLAAISSRRLAAEVGVSHTLVNYHFGSRDDLVAAAIALRAAPHDVIALARGRDGHGPVDLSRLAHGILAVWEHPEHGAQLVGLARRLAAADESAASISGYIQVAVFEPLVADFGREHARRMAVAIVGFLFGRYVLELPMFATLPREEAGRLLLSMIR
ncbi:TetR/AcrR family transcriptional regulator [Microbacterium sp. ZOR0019]|uniref:TetR/AcrR family transcriptional regulator n=1 Tax=Microbacterium sp. ZOR0019 TaxID=1339233 RepID=UPI00068F8B3A|nr:TetR family transcriptional regulator [Microbacterium sp. ZOR0019]